MEHSWGMPTDQDINRCEGPAAAIRADGRSIRQIALAAGLDPKTVWAASFKDRWPAQRRTRQWLMKALGLVGEEVPHV
jgi:lambda repressor-like predicted transcriptional regulator